MSEITDKSSDLLNLILEAYSKLQIDKKIEQYEELGEQMQAPDFWNNQQKAQEISRTQARLNKEIKPWIDMKTEVEELVELANMKDQDLEPEMNKKLVQLNKNYEDLKKDLRFSGEHDSFNAILSIQAGAGGTDAQDWAEMLRRMYSRWSEKTDMKVTILDESSGEEAGIKSSTLKIEGNNAYGLLKSEHGVHRLVRLSPFNSAHSRETSFAMVEVIPEIESSEVEIDESDLKIDVYRSGGRGGQSVNTTDSAVRITHIPTGVVVAIQNERSQLQNKEQALKILRSKLYQMSQEQHKDKLEELKGPNMEAAWGNQIRSYVLHPYTLVKDNRTNYQSSDTEAILNGQINEFIDAYLEYLIGSEQG